MVTLQCSMIVCVFSYKDKEGTINLNREVGNAGDNAGGSFTR